MMLSEPFLWLVILPPACAPLVYLLGRLADRRVVWPAAQAAPYRMAGGGGMLAAPATLTVPAQRRLPLAALGALAVLGLMWIPFGMAAQRINAGVSQVFFIELIPLRFDGLSLLLTAAALGLGSLVTLFSIAYMRREQHEEKYYAMLLVMIGAIIGLGCAGDLFNLWVWFEAMAVSSYLLVVFYRSEAAALEAAVKYVFQSAVGSVLVLVGIALVLMQTGELQLSAIAAKAAADPSPVLLAAGGLFVVGFGVKTALAPMHTWLPDAHSQAPSGISAMLSGVVIATGLAALLRTVAPLTGSGVQGYAPVTWGILLVAAGAINMLLGNLMALRQSHVKRLLAYSSISHMGYMVFGVGAALYAGQAAGAQGASFHLLTHAMMKGLAFLCAGLLMYAAARPQGGDDDHAAHQPLLVSDLNGAAQRFPLAALALSVALLGLGGLPPLAGFMSKWQIFVAGFSSGSWELQALVVFMAFNSVLSLGYYAPLVSALYKKNASPAMRMAEPVPWSMTLPLLLLAAGVIALGLWPQAVEWLTVPAAQAIMAAFGG